MPRRSAHKARELGKECFGGYPPRGLRVRGYDNRGYGREGERDYGGGPPPGWRSYDEPPYGARLPAIRFALVLPPIVSDGDPDPKSLQFSCRHQAQLSLDYSATRARNGSSQGSPPKCAISPGQNISATEP